jgi:hypothetical protein
MSKSNADIDGSDSHEAVRQTYDGTKPVLPPGWWDGGASERAAYRRRLDEAKIAKLGRVL